MKKLANIGLMITVLLFISGNVFAQLSINKGLKVGYNIADLSLDPSSETSSRSSFAGGGYVELDLLGPIDFQAEVLYSPKGAKVKSEGQEITVKGDYLEIPLLVKFQMPLLPTLSWNIHAGPSFGFKISEGTDPKTDTNGDLFKSSDLGGAIGAGVKFSALISSVTVDARYTFGFNDVSAQSDIKVKNNVFALLLGIGF